MKRKAPTTYPTIALVGRTNVGKSTLFNRLIEKQKALVSDVSGTTRTRNTGILYWRGEAIMVVDTGGLTFENELLFEREVLEQSELALAEADVVVFVVDVQIGTLPQEKELAKRLRKLNKPVVVVANKADTDNWRTHAFSHEWSALGFGDPLPVSAANGSGIGDMLDAVHQLLPLRQDHSCALEREIAARVTIIGKPNVGKSSLLNALAGAREVIVSEIPHTTRESFDVDILHDDKYFRFIDTAGIRKKARVQKGLEKLGVADSIRSFDDAQVALLVLDATEPFSSQEKHLMSLIEGKHAGIVVIVNKWDLVEDHSQEARSLFIKMIHGYYPFLTWAPIIFVSAKSGTKVHQIFETVERVVQQRKKIIEPDVLETWLKTVTKKHRPSRGKGSRHPKVLSFSQVATEPPVFEAVIKYKTSVHDSYIHFLENQLREHFDFEGTPVTVYIRKYKR